jgi:hypothetical protein
LVVCSVSKLTLLGAILSAFCIGMKTLLKETLWPLGKS